MSAADLSATQELNKHNLPLKKQTKTCNLSHLISMYTSWLIGFPYYGISSSPVNQVE